MRYILIIFILCISTVYAVDFSGTAEILGSLKSSGEKDIFHQTTIKASQYKGDVYTEVSVRNEKTENNDHTTYWYRAFIELYKDNYTLSAGKQKINWGNSHFFNYANIFSKIDVDDPKREQEGIRAVAIKYNNGLTSRIETAVLLETDRPDYAFRYTFTRGFSEYMFNYFDHYKERSFGNVIYKTHYKDLVLECKGESTIGYWFQGVFRSADTESLTGLDLIPEHQTIYVAGIDYTFGLYNRNLYILAEFNHNESLKQKNMYLHTRYDIQEDISYSQNYAADLNKNSYYYSSIVQYLFNDSVTVQLEYNKYNNFILNTESQRSDDENISMRITTYF